MSRLHSIQAEPIDIAYHFGVEMTAGLAALDVPQEITEGLGGLVVIERNGRRLLWQMDWGFPRQTQEGRLRGDLPQRVGLVADLTNRMWDGMVVNPAYRCLIVLTHFANPDGVQGSKTRTGFSVKDQPIMAWAGFCRNVPDYGPVYAGMTMTANAAVPPTNDRMPVLLDPDEYGRWLHGPIDDVLEFQFRPPIAADRMKVERTDDLWRSDAGPPGSKPQFALL